MSPIKKYFTGKEIKHNIQLYKHTGSYLNYQMSYQTSFDSLNIWIHKHQNIMLDIFLTGPEAIFTNIILRKNFLMFKFNIIYGLRHTKKCGGQEEWK